MSDDYLLDMKGMLAPAALLALVCAVIFSAGMVAGWLVWG